MYYSVILTLFATFQRKSFSRLSLLGVAHKVNIWLVAITAVLAGKS